MDYTLDVKRTRVQLSELELKTLIYHLGMEVDSLTDVYHDLLEKGDDQEIHSTHVELSNLTLLRGKIIRAYKKLQKK